MSAKIRMYNAGDRIKEPISFSIPDTYGDVHAIARWELDAPAQSFFSVPTEMRLGQGEKIKVEFPYDVARKFGVRGVVLIDEDEYGDKDIPDNQPFAATDEQAIEKGKSLWNAYLSEIARAHLDVCAAARAVGGAPRAAQGFTKRALKLMGQPDPGEHIFSQQVQAASTNNPDVIAMKAQVDQMAAMMEEMRQANAKLVADMKAQRTMATEDFLAQAQGKEEDRPKAKK